MPAQFELPAPVQEALQTLELAGHEAWLVGGCVRDHYLGRQPGDYDIATAARPEQTKAAFPGRKTLDTGVTHGTVTLLTGGMALEITTFRADGAYTDHRRPDSVRFVSGLKEDLARRDFTVNAMAYHPLRGLNDPFQGRDDCDRGLLRAVGEPPKRFEEDALRVLRGLRFSSQLGFLIEQRTLDAMMAARDSLLLVAAERIAQELNRLLLGAHTETALRHYPGLLFAALPELAPLLSASGSPEGLWERTLRRVAMAPYDPATRWAALYLEAAPGGAPADSARLLSEAMLRLRQSGALREQAVALAQGHTARIDPDNLRLYLSRTGFDTTLKLLLLQRADLAARGAPDNGDIQRLDWLYGEAQRINQAGEALRVRDLAVGGHDLRALGYPADQRLGRALETLLDLVLRGKLTNEKAALLEKAWEMLQGGA